MRLNSLKLLNVDEPASNLRGNILDELIRTNDVVVLSLAQSLLKDAGIGHLLTDENMSVLEGSIGMLPKRLLVDSDEVARARRLMKDAGLGDELRDA